MKASADKNTGSQWTEQTFSEDLSNGLDSRSGSHPGLRSGSHSGSHSGNRSGNRSGNHSGNHSGSIGAPPFVDLRQYHQPGYEAGGSRVAMLLWWLIQAVVFPLTLHTAHGIRSWLLRRFGAKIGQQVIIRPTARFTYPWNIEIGDYSWIGDDVVLYSLAPIKIGCHCVVSQKSYLCTGSHNINDPRFSLVTGEIVVENGAWIATDSFIGPSIRIGANAVIGARSTVFHNMPAGQICLGTPCKPLKARPMND